VSDHHRQGTEEKRITPSLVEYFIKDIPMEEKHTPTDREPA
jgi:hypothetical protein